MAKRGKAAENAWLRRCREVTGWGQEEAHRHDAESRVSEKGVGDFVLPAPVVVQLRAQKNPNPWQALRDAEAAADGTEKRAVAGLVVKRGGGHGREQYRLVGMRRPTMLWLGEQTGLWVMPLRPDSYGLVAAYEEVLEVMGVAPRRMEAAMVLEKRGGEEQMVVVEEWIFHKMLKHGWGAECLS